MITLQNIYPTHLEISPFQQKGNFVGSEVLPAGWNGDQTLYCLRYVEAASNRTFLMKALAIDGNLNLNFMVIEF